MARKVSYKGDDYMGNSKIDIIIPCYNSQKTLARTLYSIAMQTIANEIKVIVVADGDDADYKPIISKFTSLDIEYIYLPINKGVATARNTGFERGCSPYVFFLDSDDCLSNPLAMEMLLQEIENDLSLDVVSGNFVNDIRKDGRVKCRVYKSNMTWIHGLLIARLFLDKTNIRFSENLKTNEDALFRQEMALCGANEKHIDFMVTNWISTENSLSRKNRYRILYDYAQECIEFFKVAKKRKSLETEFAVGQFVNSIIMLYWYYTEVRQTESAEKADEFFEVCKKFYAECYVNVAKYVSEEMLRERYYFILKENDDFKYFIPDISFYDFVAEL